MLQSVLIRLARQVLQSVLTALMSQFSLVEDVILSPTRADLQAVTGGSIWRGDGADAFAQELTSIMIPNVGTIGTLIKTKHTNLERAADIITTADNQVSQVVNGLADTFASIY
ncbi:MAG: hypothetical protein KDD73_08095 [Anaerolineales bacterium]|nr:hypothetical protein [Anaerolineales bacterium]MCB9126833.1 hypothetical protein [Ardenticatenales bacterium]